MLFAQVPVDPFGGWGSLILQGGAFMLLTYVVAFLAPKLMKEARDERDSRDTRFDKLVEALQVKFEERNEKIVSAVEAQTSKLSDSFARSLSSSATRIEIAVQQVCKNAKPS